MIVTETGILDCYILEPKVFGDHRGWFTESWSQKKMEDAGLYYKFVQDNHSYSSKKDTLRGIHFQKGDAAQAKLVRCVKGVVLDLAIDLRIGSPTYKKWLLIELSEENKKQLLIPRGFGHAFITITDEVEFLYKADNYYNFEADRSINWKDPDLNIDWDRDDFILSEKDKNAPFLKDSDIDFVYKEI